MIGDDKRLSSLRARMDRCIEYFRLVEAAFDRRETITSTALHQAIDSPVHRTHLLAYRFLVNELGLESTGDDRDLSNEARRLEDILDRAADLPSAGLLSEYVAQLQLNGLAPRTVRLYAGVAQNFCQRTGASKARCWRVGAIEVFLKHTPGAANSLSKFVNYCRRKYGWDVQMPPKATLDSASDSAKKAVDRMRRALSGVAGRPTDELKLMEVTRVIAAATGLKLRHLIEAKSVSTSCGDGETVKLADHALIEPGHPLHPFARRWRSLIAMRGTASVESPRGDSDHSNLMSGQ